jgi:hypothetical protein
MAITVAGKIAPTHRCTSVSSRKGIKPEIFPRRIVTNQGI